MTIAVEMDEGEGDYCAAVKVDGEVVHAVTGFSRLGALAAVLSMCEADFEKARSVMIAVRSSLGELNDAEYAMETFLGGGGGN